MKETLKMMKRILNGKEGTVNEKEIIKEYQEKLSPNILAYFYCNNFGMIIELSNSYPMLLDEDKASFCLQILDTCLQTYNLESNTKFTTYFYRCYKNRLNTEYRLLNYNKRKNLINSEQLDNLIIPVYDNIDLIDNYNLTDIEKRQCKLLSFGYTIKEIAKIFNITSSAVCQRNNKIKEKILSFT